MPFDPRHASQDSCCRSNFGQVDGSFFVRRKRAIVRVNESCGGDVAVVRGQGTGGVARTVIRGVASLRMYDVRSQGPLILYTAGRIEFYAPPIFPYRIVLIALVISLARVDAAQMEILFPFFELLYCPLCLCKPILRRGTMEFRCVFSGRSCAPLARPPLDCLFMQRKLDINSICDRNSARANLDSALLQFYHSHETNVSRLSS